MATDIPEVEDLKGHVSGAREKQRLAKHHATVAAKKMEKAQKDDAVDPAEVIPEAIHHAEIAKTEIQAAEIEQKEGAERLKSEKLKRIRDGGPTIAGYTVIDLIKAVAVPPEPHTEKPSPVSKPLQKEIEKENKELKAKIKQTKREIKEVEQKIQDAESA